MESTNQVVIKREGGGYDISVYLNGEKVKSNWKSNATDAYNTASIFSDYYRDENGQSLNINQHMISGELIQL